MAGGGGSNHRNSGRSRGHPFLGKISVFSVWFGILVALETHALVHAQCSFTWKDSYSSPAGNGSRDLELICECAKGKAKFARLVQPYIEIIYCTDACQKEHERPLFTGYHSKPVEPPIMDRVEKIANELEEDNNKGGSRVYLRLKGYTHTANVHFRCKIYGRKDDQSMATQNQTIPLSSKPGPRIQVTKATTTTTTTTTTTAATPRRTAAPIDNIPGKLPVIPASAVGNTEEGFNRVGIYVVISLSGLLLVCIVIIISCFVRVRERRKREKLDVEKNLDPGALMLHPANHACALHASCQPLCQHQADVPMHQPRGKKDRRAPRDETVPLLNIQCPEGCDLRHPPMRPATTNDDDNDDDDDEKPTMRRQKLLKDHPGRSQSRDRVPPRSRVRHSRSCDHMYREKLPYRRGLQPRPRNPRHVYDDISDDEEEGWYNYRSECRPVCRHPPRSRSEFCLRHPRNRYAVPREDYAYWEGYCHHCQASPPPTGGGREIPILDDDLHHHAVPLTPTRGPARVWYDDSEAAYGPRNARGGGGGRRVARAVRVQEGNSNTVYETRTGPQAGARMFGSSSDGEATLQGDPLEGVGLEGDGEWEGEGEGRRTARGGDPYSVSRLAQPRLLPEHLYPADSATPSRRYRHLPPSPPPPPPPHHNSSTSTSRRSPERRAACSARPVHHNLSHPHLFYLAQDEDMDPPHLYQDAPQAEDLPQPQQPPQFSSCRRPARRPRVKGRRRSRSLGNLENDADEDSSQPPRNPRRRRKSSGRPAAVQGLGELSQLSPRTREGASGEQQRPLNFLSRDGSPPQRSPTHLLNVPVARVPSPGSASARDQQHDTTQRKMPVGDGDVPADASRVEAESRRPTAQRARASAAEASESSPGTTPPPPRRQRRPPSTSSDNGDPRLVVTEAEINLRDIKADNETQRKRPVSVKIGNVSQRPIVCVADAARNQGAKPHAPASSRGLQKKKSTRSSGGADPPPVLPRKEEVVVGRGCVDDLGIEILSFENGSGHSSLCSNFTEHNHSTSAKALHPRA